jgi:hypothetical protein
MRTFSLVDEFTSTLQSDLGDRPDSENTIKIKTPPLVKGSGVLDFHSIAAFGANKRRPGAEIVRQPRAFREFCPYSRNAIGYRVNLALKPIGIYRTCNFIETLWAGE